MSDACEAAEKRMEDEFGRLSILAQKTSHNTRHDYNLRAEGVAMALTFLREEMRARSVGQVLTKPQEGEQ